jgi:succinylglutamate desuccinylase
MPINHLEILNYFNTHASPVLPYLIELRGPKPGHHVCLIGGTHGNEPSGAKAIERFHQWLQKGQLRLTSGKVSLIMGNPEAFLADRRYLDEDLNRAFGRRDASSIEGRRACAIEAYLASQQDLAFVLDLHSVSIGNFKLLAYEADSFPSVALFNKLSPLSIHFAFHSEHLPGSLIGAAGKLGATGLIIECGNHQCSDGINTAYDHILRVLQHFNMLENDLWPDIATNDQICQYESIQAIKPGINFTFLIDGVETGTQLVKGQVYAKDDARAHVAPENSYLVVPSESPKPTDADAGFICRRKMLSR